MEHRSQKQKSTDLDFGFAAAEWLSDRHLVLRSTSAIAPFESIFLLNTAAAIQNLRPPSPVKIQKCTAPLH